MIPLVFLNVPVLSKRYNGNMITLLIGQKEVTAIITLITVLKSKQVMISHHPFINAGTLLRISRSILILRDQNRCILICQTIFSNQRSILLTMLKAY